MRSLRARPLDMVADAVYGDACWLDAGRGNWFVDVVDGVAYTYCSVLRSGERLGLLKSHEIPGGEP